MDQRFEWYRFYRFWRCSIVLISDD